VSSVIDILLITLTTVGALWAVMRGTLIRAAIALALTSVMVTIVLFRLHAPLAAVFELSVCAGLITVVFMSTVSLTKARTYEETMKHTKKRFSRYWLLPPLVLIAGVVLAIKLKPLSLYFPFATTGTDVRSVLWNLRQADIIGQILILLVGVFGIVILFKDKKKSGKEI
jgi:NADH-quinone oxidoreductase subunit J